MATRWAALHAVAGALLVCFDAGGCYRSCTDVGCPSFGLSIGLMPMASNVAPGNYAIDVGTPYGTWHVQCGVPQDPAPFPCNCQITPPVTSACLTHERGWIWIDAQPDSVTIDIARDGQPIASRTLTPSYWKERPNGPDCEPECEMASEGTLDF